MVDYLVNISEHANEILKNERDDAGFDEMEAYLHYLLEAIAKILKEEDINSKEYEKLTERLKDLGYI